MESPSAISSDLKGAERDVVTINAMLATVDVTVVANNCCCRRGYFFLLPLVTVKQLAEATFVAVTCNSKVIPPIASLVRCLSLPVAGAINDDHGDDRNGISATATAKNLHRVLFLGYRTAPGRLRRLMCLSAICEQRARLAHRVTSCQSHRLGRDVTRVRGGVYRDLVFCKSHHCLREASNTRLSTRS